MLDRERFDVLHFHEPFVPFLSLQLLRHSQSVNVATFHAYSGWSPRTSSASACCSRFARRLHGRIAVSAAARHFIDRYFPGDYKVIPNGVDLARFALRSPSRAGATARSTSSSWAASRPRKGVMYLLKAYRQLRLRGLQLPAADRRRRAAGARGPPLHRHPPAGGRRAAGSRQRRGQGPRASPPRTCSCRRRPARSRSASCCWRRWPRARPSCAATSTATRASCGAASRPARAAARRRRAGRRARHPAARPEPARAHGRVGPPARGPVRLGEHHGQGRGLLRLRHPPGGGPGPSAAAFQPSAGQRTARAAAHRFVPPRPARSNPARPARSARSARCGSLGVLGSLGVRGSLGSSLSPRTARHVRTA